MSNIKLDAATKEAVEYENNMNAIYDYQSKDFNLVQNMSGDASSGLWDAETKAFLDSTNLKSLFYSEDWVYIAVDLVALKISNQPLRVMKTEIINGEKVSTPDEDHKVNSLLAKPNPKQDYNSWMYNLSVDYALIGNSFQWNRPGSNMIIGIPAETVTLDFSGNGKLESYTSYMFDSDLGEINRQSGTRYKPIEIIHFMKPNPSSYYWGLSGFVPGRKSILFNRYSSEFLNNFYIKGATPGLALELDKEANEKVALRLLRSFEQAYTGRRNQRRTMILPKGVSAKPVSSSLADQQLKDYIDKNRESILAILKIPKHEVGLQTSGSLGSEEYKTALKNFWASTLKPMQSMIAGSLTKHFSGQLGPDRFLEFDNSSVDILKDDELTKAELAAKLKTTHTVNEIRASLYKLEPIDGGDQLEGQGFQSFAPKQIEPAKEEAEDDKNQNDKSLDTLRQKQIRNADLFFKSNETWWDGRQGKIDSEVDSKTQEYVRSVLDMFSKMAPELVETSVGYIRDQSKKGFISRKDISRATLKRRLRKLMDGFEEKFTEDHVKILESTTDVGYDAAMSLPFNLPDQDEIDVLRAENEEKKRVVLEERGIDIFELIKETNVKQVLNTIDQGISESKTVQQIAKDIADKYRSVKNILKRAETIARTETLTAVSVGQAAAMEDASKIIPNLRKMWVTAGDNRVRGNPGGLYAKSNTDHFHLHGVDVASDKPFIEPGSGEKIMYPREPGVSAGNTINCRCSWIMVPKDQMDEISSDQEFMEQQR